MPQHPDLLCRLQRVRYRIVKPVKPWIPASYTQSTPSNANQNEAQLVSAGNEHSESRVLSDPKMITQPSSRAQQESNMGPSPIDGLEQYTYDARGRRIAVAASDTASEQSGDFDQATPITSGISPPGSPNPTARCRTFAANQPGQTFVSG